MRNDAGINGDAQRIEQIAWMLFLKVYDAKEQDWEWDDEDYVSILPEECRWANWAHDDKSGKAMTGDKLLNFVNNTLFPTLKKLPVDSSTPIKKAIVQTTFADANQYMKDGILLRQVINVIDELDLSDYEETHAFAEIYETILKELQSAGSSGEFYTPRAVTDFMAKMVQPQIGEKMADFACGTGGFITSWLKELEKKVETTEDKENYSNSIYGIEKKQFPYYNPDLLKKYECLAPYGGRFIDDFTHFQKATSLSSNGINSMPMWAHYAANHRGFCVSYKMEDNLSLNSSTFPVQYTDQRLDVTELMRQHAEKADVRKFVSPEDVHSFVLEDLSIVYMACWLCNIKHSSWSYEREFRCTMGATAKGMPYVEAKPKEIYVGMNCSPEHTSRLIEIAKEQKIPIFKMVFDECSSTYDLIPRKISI